MRCFPCFKESIDIYFLCKDVVFLQSNFYCIFSNFCIVKKVTIMAEALKHSPWCFPATNEA